VQTRASADLETPRRSAARGREGMDWRKVFMAGSRAFGVMRRCLSRRGAAHRARRPRTPDRRAQDFRTEDCGCRVVRGEPHVPVRAVVTGGTAPESAPQRPHVRVGRPRGEDASPSITPSFSLREAPLSGLSSRDVRRRARGGSRRVRHQNKSGGLKPNQPTSSRSSRRIRPLSMFGSGVT